MLLVELKERPQPQPEPTMQPSKQDRQATTILHYHEWKPGLVAWLAP